VARTDALTRESIETRLVAEFGRNAVKATRNGFAVTCEGVTWDFRVDRYTAMPSVFREHVSHIRHASVKLAEEARRA